MGSLCTDSFEDFLESLKNAGVEISNERELRERLAEAQRWRYTFNALAMNGRAIGIRFSGPDSDANSGKIHQAFAMFQFPESYEAVFSASLKAN